MVESAMSAEMNTSDEECYDLNQLHVENFKSDIQPVMCDRFKEQKGVD